MTGGSLTPSLGAAESCYAICPPAERLMVQRMIFSAIAAKKSPADESADRSCLEEDGAQAEGPAIRSEEGPLLHVQRSGDE